MRMMRLRRVRRDSVAISGILVICRVLYYNYSGFGGAQPGGEEDEDDEGEGEGVDDLEGEEELNE